MIQQNLSCALCGLFPPQENSHIIPDFVFRWLKATSATPFMRNASNPNKRIQDGKKYPLLCEACEDLFSCYEDSFASTVFHPYSENHNQIISYDADCLKFCVSLVWRGLHHLWLNEAHSGEPLQEELQGKLDEPYKIWAEYLLGNRPHPDRFTVNVIPVGDITSTNISRVPRNLSQYYTGTTDMDLVCGSQCGFVYVKIPHFMIFGKIFETTGHRFAYDTRVRANNGIINPSRITVSQEIEEYIFSRCDLIIANAEQVTASQIEAIKKSLARDPERVKNSRSVKSAIHDAKLRTGTQETA